MNDRRATRPFLDAPRPLGFAHRGGASLWPENTMLAFRGATELGLRFLESDIHATRDGVLVLHHDETVDATTNGSGLLREKSFEELRSLDAAFWFSPDGTTFPHRGTGVVIPTLAEVLDELPDARLNLEIKQRGIEAAVFDLLVERRARDRVLIAAANDRIGRSFRQVSGGSVATSAATQETLRFWIAVRLGLSHRLTPTYDALQVPVASGPLRIVDGRFVEAAHRAGLHVHVWTIDDAFVMRQLLALDVDGIMTDRPDVFVALPGADSSQDSRTDRLGGSTVTPS